MLRSLIFFLFLVFAALGNEAETLIKRAKYIYKQEKCWSMCNLVTEMPMDTAIGISANTRYINVKGYGAVVGIVDTTVVEGRTWMVGVSYWVCGKKSKKYRVHFYKKNSNGILYEVRRLNVKEGL